MESHPQYFDRDPTVPSRPIAIRFRVGEHDLSLQTDRGVFSHGRVDPGTKALLRVAPPPPKGDLLDLGCGYGVIAAALAVQAPRARVWAVDVNERALKLVA